MPLWIRRTIYLSFVALFVIIAPLLALYSMGYRYQWAKRQFESTGLIVVDGTPIDAAVLLDGVRRADQLPARIGGLHANDYTLRVERPGFKPWETRVNVASGRTTFATRLRLFRDAVPHAALAGRITTFIVSADRRWASFIRRDASAEELWFLDLRTTRTTLALRLPATPAGITTVWSPRGANLLAVAPGSSPIVLDPDRPNARNPLATLLTTPMTDLRWELGSSTALTGVRNGHLSRISLAPSRVTTLAVPVPTGPYAVAHGTRYAADVHGITATDTDGGQTRTITPALTDTMIRAFIDLTGTVLTVVTRPDDTRVRIETTTGKTAVLPGMNAERSPTDARVELSRTRSELWITTDDTAPELLERRAIPIVDATWDPAGGYIYAATATEVVAIARSSPSAAAAAIPLAAFDAVTAIAPTTDGRALAIVARRGSDEGLWVLPLE